MSGFPYQMAEGVRQRWIPGVNGVGALGTRGIAEELVRGAYALAAATPGREATFHLPPNSSDLAAAFASEVARFGTAAFETMLGARPSQAQPRALSWPLIKSYYAAFFAAHALLRLTGESITYLSATQVNAIDTVIASYLGTGSGFVQGLYHVQTVLPSRSIRLILLNRGGGSHDSLWQRFYQFLMTVENELARNFAALPDALSAIRTSQQLRQQLSAGGVGQGTWLSHSRNNINYRHLEGVWYPYGIPRREADRLGRSFDDWRSQEVDWDVALGANGKLALHVSLTQSVVAILHRCLSDVSSRSTARGHSFVDRAPLAFLRHEGVER
jgi:hypothetical protein